MNSASSATAQAIPAVRSFALPARRGLTLVLGTLLIAVCAHIAVPLWFTPVPVTLQTFAVLLLALMLSPAMAASVMVLYLLEGMAGLPVLAPTGTVSLLHIFGPTGGYLLSYPLAAALTSYLRRRLTHSGSFRAAFAASATAAALGSAVILLCGAAWFAALLHVSVAAAFTMALAPFLAGDILKVAAASSVASGLRRFRRA